MSSICFLDDRDEVCVDEGRDVGLAWLLALRRFLCSAAFSLPFPCLQIALLMNRKVRLLSGGCSVGSLTSATPRGGRARIAIAATAAVHACRPGFSCLACRQSRKSRTAGNWRGWLADQWRGVKKCVVARAITHTPSARGWGSRGSGVAGGGPTGCLGAARSSLDLDHGARGRDQVDGEVVGVASGARGGSGSDGRGGDLVCSSILPASIRSPYSRSEKPPPLPTRRAAEVHRDRPAEHEVDLRELLQGDELAVRARP